MTRLKSLELFFIYYGVAYYFRKVQILLQRVDFCIENKELNAISSMHLQRRHHIWYKFTVFVENVKLGMK